MSTPKIVPVHVVVIGKPSMLRAMMQDERIAAPTTMHYAQGSNVKGSSNLTGPRAYVGKRADFDGTDEAWRERCALLFADSEQRAEQRIMAFFASVILKQRGTLIVVAERDALEHDPESGTYCKIPGRDMLAELQSVADLTIYA